MRNTKLGGVVMVLILASLAAAQTKPLKPFVPPIPPMGFAVGGVLLRDPPCAKDYLKAEALEGVAQGKAFAELVTFGCAQVLHGVYHVVSREPVTLPDGKKVAWFWHSLLTKDRYMSFMLLGGEKPDGDERDGWVAESSIVKISEDELSLAIYDSTNSAGFSTSLSETERAARLWKRVEEIRRVLK